MTALSAMTAAAVLLAGCGYERPRTPSDGPESPEPIPSPAAAAPRMRAVADAWAGSVAARAWRDGYFPLEGEEQLPEGAWHTGDDKIAHGEGRLRPPARLPDAGGPTAAVRWKDGRSVDVAVAPVAQLYPSLTNEELAKGGPALIVTRIVMGRMTIRTNRGPAEVPAWVLTIDGYGTPLKRAAVRAPVAQTSPVEPLDTNRESADFRPVEGLGAVSADGRTVTVLAGHGSCDDGAEVEVLETAESVVFAGRIVGVKEGICRSDLQIDRVRVTLTEPLGNRVPVDAFRGTALGRPAWAAAHP